jgi:hypothetical protein
MLAEELPAHVVIDALDCPAALVEEGDDLRADEPAGAGDECGLARQRGKAERASTY